MAALLTLVILVAYGGYTAWNAVVGGDESATTPVGDGFEASTSRAIEQGNLALFYGVNLRILKDVYRFRDGVDGMIGQVRADRANVERIATTGSPTEVDIALSTAQAMSQLEAGMAQWRDTIFLVQLGRVEQAESAVRSALAQLEADLERWRTSQR